jgi:hypothetical protein
MVQVSRTSRDTRRRLTESVEAETGHLQRGQTGHLRRDQGCETIGRTCRTDMPSPTLSVRRVCVGTGTERGGCRKGEVGERTN